MTEPRHLPKVCSIMERFADKTGLTSSHGPPRRYLWTDAFAVCNFLELQRLTGRERYGQLALDLVDQVHQTLGKHRDDDSRSGWISGLNDTEGAQHPTIGGLRIGKNLAERTPEQPFDERLEWDRDGQYYHYLTKWMHALHQVSVFTDDTKYNNWASELARTAHRAFVHRPTASKTNLMYWKMSIDLSCPVVPSMGHHDPLDGFVTYQEISRFSESRQEAAAPFDLVGEIADLVEMCRARDWTTADPLGIGGLLFDAFRLLQMKAGADGLDDHGLLVTLLESSNVGLQAYLARNSLTAPAEARLAFREFGMAIGLRAVEMIPGLLDADSEIEVSDVTKRLIENLVTDVPVAKAIEDFWLERPNREARSWRDHEDINMVMLATSLAPNGYLRCALPWRLND